MKHLMKVMIFSSLLLACSEAEIETATAVLLDEEKTITVILKNIPEGQDSNPVFVATLNSNNDAYSVIESVATEDAEIATVPPPGTNSFSIVVFIPTTEDWTIEDGFSAGYYSSLTGTTNRNARFITNSWDNAASYDDSSQEGTANTLSIDLAIDGETTLTDNEFTPGEIIVLSGSVDNNTDLDVTSVSFSVDGNEIESINEMPYSINYNTLDLSEGTHIITVAVTNGTDNASDELEIEIVITANEGPSVSITSITNGSEIERQTLRTITASASDDNEVANVRFIIAGSTVFTDDTFPYSYEWDTFDNALGTITIEVVATDDQGVSRSDFVNVILTEPEDYFPRVSITSPGNGNAFGTGSIITINTSTNDPDGDPIGQVDYYIDGGYIGSDTEGPFSIDWNTTGYGTGTFVIRAIVYNEDFTSGGAISRDEITVTIQ